MTNEQKMELIPLVIKINATLEMAKLSQADRAVVEMLEEILNDALCHIGISKEVLLSNY